MIIFFSYRVLLCTICCLIKHLPLQHFIQVDIAPHRVTCNPVNLRFISIQDDAEFFLRKNSQNALHLLFHILLPLLNQSPFPDFLFPKIQPR